MTRIPLPRTVLGWTTVVMVGWLAVVFVGAAVSGYNPLLALASWACIFAPVLIVVALIDRVVSDRRGARDVHAAGGAWQVPEYMPEDVQHAPLPQQPDHNPWA